MALRRPGTVLAVGLVLLGALSLPAIGMQLGMPGARVVDEGRTSRDGYEMLVQVVRPGRGRARLRHRPGAPGRRTWSRIASRRPTARRRPRRRAAGRERSDRRAGDRAHAGRRLPDRRPGRTGSATVSPTAVPGGTRSAGPAAQNADLTSVLTGRAPIAIGLILLLAFVLLLFVFRSLVDRASRPSS